MALTGLLDTATLVAVQDGLRLTAVAAASWRALAADVQARHGWLPTLTDAYRDYAAQVKVFTDRYERASTGPGAFGDVRYWNGVRYVRMRGASAAVPGTSNHGRGNTVDVRSMTSFTTTRFRQFSAVAIAHGWSNVEGRSVKEPWHWVKVSAGITPTPSQEDDVSAADVIEALVSPAGQKALADAIMGPGSRYPVRNPLKAGEMWPVPDALRIILDYTIKAYLEAHAAKTAATGATADVDEAALARELAPLLATVAPALDDDALAALAKAVNDEADQRARQRLA